MLYTTASQSTVECFISQPMSVTPPDPNYKTGNLYTFDIIGSSWMLVAKQSVLIYTIILQTCSVTDYHLLLGIPYHTLNISTYHEY